MATDTPCRGAPSALPGLNAAQVAAVRRAQAFMESNLGQPIDVVQIAAAACVSRFHLARLFRSATGLSPTGWLRQRRIDQARHWLREGSQPVGRIASELAFFDQSHFTRTFRAATGCSPRCYASHAATPH
ncbi:helix-turn-helix transcriptional regulator [Stenotrophomonas pennii]|uniref:helix-turn-helix transcriptional regulator n=1 Tax=Stenotrophomonas lacuserhaii TaxID=2760084 RepID=UPI00320AB997